LVQYNQLALAAVGKSCSGVGLQELQEEEEVVQELGQELGQHLLLVGHGVQLPLTHVAG
jgi:hypothetical protein